MFTKSIFTALVASITIGSFPAPVSAEIINSNINVSESDLRAQCGSAGGSFTKYSDGTYGCIIHKADGGLTTVSCDADQSCIGTTDNRQTVRAHKAKTRSGGMVVLGIATQNPIKKHMFTRGTMPVFK